MAPAGQCGWLQPHPPPPAIPSIILRRKSASGAPPRNQGWSFFGRWTGWGSGVALVSTGPRPSHSSFIVHTSCLPQPAWELLVGGNQHCNTILMEITYFQVDITSILPELINGVPFTFQRSRMIEVIGWFPTRRSSHAGCGHEDWTMKEEWEGWCPTE